MFLFGISENSNTLEHHLIHCGTSKQIWHCFMEWLNSNLLINNHLTECEILFEIPYTNTIDLQAIYFLILFTKGFINRKKTLKLRLYFIEFLSELKAKLYAITLANTLNERPNLDWQNHLKDEL